MTKYCWILVKANYVEFLSVLVNALSVIPRSYSSFQGAVARRVAAALPGAKTSLEIHLANAFLVATGMK
jgi:hypothetical protein